MKHSPQVHRWKSDLLRGFAVMAVLALFALVLNGVARADTVLNNVENNVNSVTIPQGQSVSVLYWLETQDSADPVNGCNATGNTPATINIGTLPTGVTASPASFQIAGCGSNNAVSVVFSSTAAGTFQIPDVSVLGGKTGGSYYTDLTDFQLKVVPSDSTAPVITPTVAGTLGSNGWYTSDVSVSWSVSDGESAITNSSGCGTSLVTADTAGTTFTCSATSAGGPNSQSVTIKRDANAPSIALASLHKSNGDLYTAGTWTKAQSVTATFSCADNGPSGVVNSIVPVTLSNDGANQTATGSCVDNAGNSAGLTVQDIDIDHTDPVITYVGRTAATGTDGDGNAWNNGDVTVNWTCADATSGPVNANISETVSAEGADESVTGKCVDNAGNEAPNTQGGINIDKNAPVIGASATSNNQPYTEGTWSRYDVHVTFTCTDSGSGVAVVPNEKTIHAEDGTVNDGSVTSSTGCKDYAGNESSPLTFSGKVDKQAPVITASAKVGTEVYDGDWTNQSVTVHFICSDGAGSGIEAGACPSDVVVSASSLTSAGTTVTGTVVDKVGNSASDGIVVKVDKDAPTVSFGSFASPNAHGWYNTDVSIPFNASDDLSGVDSTSPASSPLVLSAEGTAVSGTVTVTDHAGNSVIATSPAVNLDKTAPAVDCAGPRTTWDLTDVSIACTAEDSLSGLANDGDADFTLMTNVDNGTETQNAATNSHTVTDLAGNSSTAGPITGNWVDKKAPGYECGAAPSGWSATDIVIACTAADGGSGLSNSGLSSFTLSTSVPDGNETNMASTGTQLLEDAVGNGVTAGPFTNLKVDKKAPSVSCGGADGNWHADNVTIACTASDNGSGLQNTSEGNFGLSTSVSAGTETANASTGSRQIADAVGNQAQAGPISGNKIDRKAPTNITFVGSITDGASYYFGSVPSAPTCTAEDGGSGFQSCQIADYTASVGPHTLTATAKDNVGNSATKQLSYTVLSWTPKGFYQPVDMNNVINVVKAGSTVPLKFEVFAGTTELTDTSVVSGLSVREGLVAAGVATDEIEQYATGGTSLRYDATAGQFVYNLSTKGLTVGKTYTVTVTLKDGSTIVTYFKMK